MDNEPLAARSDPATRGISRLADARLLLAFAVMPFAAGSVMFLVSLAIWSAGFDVFEGGTPDDLVDAAGSLAFGVTILSVYVTVLGALPGVLWMARRAMLSFRNVVLLGAVVGNIPFVLIVAGIVVTQFAKGTLSSDVPRLWYGMFGTVRAVALGVLVGAPTAAVFWLSGLARSSTERSAFLR